MKKPLPQAGILGNALVVRFPRLCRTFGWAPLGGGPSKARSWMNLQVKASYRLRKGLEPPGKTLGREARRSGSPRPVVGQMTSGDIRRYREVVLRKKGWTLFAAGTAGFSNAVRVGEGTRHGSHRVGTINLLIWVSKPLDLATLAEMLQVAVEARTLAVLGLKVRSAATGAPATGTGTDCVTLACPAGKGRRVHAGKHTVLGELVGRGVLRVMDRRGRTRKGSS